MATIDKVKKRISDLERKLGKANKIVAKGDDIKFGDAIKLGRKSNSIVSTINKGVKEYSGVDPTLEESKDILAQMQKIVALTEEQLGLLVQHKAHFEKLHVGGLVKKNVGKTRTASESLTSLMLEKAPAEIKDEANALAKRREEAFKKAGAAFEGSSGGENEAEGEEDSD